MGRLTATAVKQAKPKPAAYKLSDGGGLYLLVAAKGARYWRYEYRYAGKRRTLALGVFPDVSLKQAQDDHQAARTLLSQGSDPSPVKRVEKFTRHLAAAESFEAVGREWFEQNIADKSRSYSERTGRILEKDLYTTIGTRPIAEITAPELLAALRRIEARGAYDIAHRAKQTAGLVFRYAVATGRAERDPGRDITGALRHRRKKHYTAITDPIEVGRLMVAIDAFQGTRNYRDHSYCQRLS